MAGHFVKVGVAGADALMRSASISALLAPSVRDRGHIREFNRCEVGRDAYPTSGYDTVGVGAVIVASIWLAFYFTAALQVLVSGIDGRW